MVALFGGLIANQGRLLSRRPLPEGAELTLETALGRELSPGDSLAVNGVCLTVVAKEGETITVQLVGKTLHTTTLGELPEGAPLNLEPALALGERLGGHLLQGHVDGVAIVERVVRRGIAREAWLAAPGHLARYIAPRGAVALDGVSLTVAAVAGQRFAVWLIPETQRRTTLGRLVEEQRVNLEVDLLAKYVERLLGKDRNES